MSAGSLLTKPLVVSGRSAIAESIQIGDAQLLATLIASGANIDSTCNDELESSLLHLAAALSSPGCIIEMLKVDPKPFFTVNRRMETPLHVASRLAESITVILLLVSVYGVDPTPNSEGDLFLHVLLRNSRVDQMKMLDLFTWLLQQSGFHGLLNYLNNVRQTPYDIALKYQGDNWQLLQLLLRNGACGSDMLPSSFVFSLAAKEEWSRERVLEAESRVFGALVGDEAASINFIKSYQRRREKVAAKEVTHRGKIVASESDSLQFLFRKEQKQLRKICLLYTLIFIQRVGRGYLHRCGAGHRLQDRSHQTQTYCQFQQCDHGCIPSRVTSDLKSLGAVDNFTASCHSDVDPITPSLQEEPLLCEVVGVLEVATKEAESVVLRGPRDRCAVVTISNFYRRCKNLRRQRAALRLQAFFREVRDRRKYIALRRGVVIIQRQWRRYWTNQRSSPTNAVYECLQIVSFARQRKLFIIQRTQERHANRIRIITDAVTRIVWRENFCSAFKDIIFMIKRRRPAPHPRVTVYQKWCATVLRIEPFLLLAQVLLSLLLLIYMGCIPRTKASEIHNSVDIAVICIQFVVACCLPLKEWRVIDMCIIITALVCAATKTYAGTPIITLLVLKGPFVVRAFAPLHSGTRSFCRAVELTGLYLVILSPIGAAGVGSTVRGSLVDELLLTRNGNWGRVFLSLWSSLFPQYTLYVLSENGAALPSNRTFPPLGARATVDTLWEGEDTALVQLQMPAAQGVLCNIILLFYTWSAIIMGTHAAFRSHYDKSDETKLKMNKHRFRNAGKMELLDAHRATSMQALGQKLEGVMWEADVRAAKEAVDASHYDHNANHKVHRFVRRVQDSVAQGNFRLDNPTKNTRKLRSTEEEQHRWDCRNEDPRSRATYDIEVIEAALGMVERKSGAERFFERQWKGPIFYRESTAVLVVMLIMASVRPNLFGMEAGFSALLLIELVLSLYYLRLDFIFSHYVQLLLRIFCIMVGFIPPAVPFVAFRFLRLLEGWSTLFAVPGMVWWGMLYSFITFLTMWMIAFVAALQYTNASADFSMCTGTTHCLSVSLRDMIIPAWTPMHIDPSHEAPVMALIIVAFQLLFIPFVLFIALHPLLQLSNFIGRFLRLVVQSLHRDVLEYLDNYLEGNLWYFHWRIREGAPCNIVVKMKLWVCDLHRPSESLAKCAKTYIRASPSSFRFPLKTFFNSPGRLASGAFRVLDEIICKGEFASFKEVEAMDALIKPQRMLGLRKFSRKPLLQGVNGCLTLASIAFLWVADITYSTGNATVVVSVVVHLLSIGTTILVFPKDITSLLTVISCASLFIAVIMVLLPGTEYRPYYTLRFISLLRIGQLQIWPFSKLMRFLRTYMLSLLRIFFPIIIIGSLSYIAELLRAQIFLVSSVYHPQNSTILDPSEWPPKNLLLPEAILAQQCTVMSLATTPESYRVVCSRLSLPPVSNTSQLFAYYFEQDAYIFYSVYSCWVLPALCVSTCLAYLYWSGTNLLDTQRLAVNIIPLLEDPITIAGFQARSTSVNWAGNFVLVVSLIFGSAFSPSTNATPDDHNFFLSFEVCFTVLGLIEAIISVAYSFHRCARSWDALDMTRRHNNGPFLVICDVLFLLAAVATLLYYSLAVPLCVSLLVERSGCLISPNDYAFYFITLRFFFLLRLLPRQYLLCLMRDSLLFLFAVLSLVVYFVGAASALADLAAFHSQAPVSRHLWSQALDSIIRQTFTSAVPCTMATQWKPLDGATLAAEMTESGESLRYISDCYASSTLLFFLGSVGRLLLACSAGLAIAVSLVPLHTLFVYSLPPKSALLFDTLSGGIRAIVRLGVTTHDDFLPETRRKVQSRKFARIFTPEGIPSWALPHLLEELNICRPNRQRRFMFALEMLLVYLPISERRQAMVMEFMDVWASYKSGAPDTLRFSSLPVFPPAPEQGGRRNPYIPDHEISREAEHRCVSPLRLVQALALFELGFPADSSVGTKLWLNFFLVVQKVRAATLVQSLWRMYKEENNYDERVGLSKRVTIASLRRRFRKYRIRSDVSFKSYETFRDALRHEYELFNPGSGHYEVLNRLRGRYHCLDTGPR